MKDRAEFKLQREARKQEVLGLLPTNRAKLRSIMGLSRGELVGVLEEMQYTDDTVHIGRWEKVMGGGWAAVYVAGDGDDCPRPSQTQSREAGCRRTLPPLPAWRDPLVEALFGPAKTIPQEVNNENPPNA